MGNNSPAGALTKGRLQGRYPTTSGLTLRELKAGLADFGPRKVTE